MAASTTATDGMASIGVMITMIETTTIAGTIAGTTAIAATPPEGATGAADSVGVEVADHQEIITVAVALITTTTTTIIATTIITTITTAVETMGDVMRRRKRGGKKINKNRRRVKNQRRRRKWRNRLEDQTTKEWTERAFNNHRRTKLQRK
jgi:hypothetical protein